MEKITYKIQDELGIHARPAGLLAKEAAKYQSEITLSCNGKTGNARKIMSVMMLGAKMGQELEVIAQGPDEKQAAEGMRTFLTENL